MRHRITLRRRLFLVLTALVVVALSGGAVMMWYTYQIDAMFKGIIDQDLHSLEAASGLENALVNQKGFVSYYFLDGNPDWLKRLERYRRAFTERLGEVRKLVETEGDRKTVDEIALEYDQYIREKDRVIAFYQSGEQEAGARLHTRVRSHFFRILDLCKHYKDIHSRRIELSRIKTSNQAKELRTIAGIALWTATLLGGLLAFILTTQVLNPLRRLSLDAGKMTNRIKSGDEVKAVSHRVHSLMEDVDRTRTELERSQKYLLHAEKLALAGKLAAGVAHSVRNPLTSVKMRLFSLGRTLDLSEIQKEDFDVISEEIRHIDTIVQHFLEFSRPPKLKMEKASPSDVVDTAVQLLRHRLESYGAAVELRRQRRLPEILADPEQLKEVLVNLLINACEAMGAEGRIVISEQEGAVQPLGQVVVIRVSDNGPGVPETIQARVFEPFFTTKEEGTGLGLSIAARIVKEHGGWLNLTSQEGKGATFIITLPCTEGQR
jgi:signal transduction histidine kinase